MKKFVILSTQRSGSAFLVTSIASHPGIECHRETFLENNSSPDSFQAYRTASLQRRIAHVFNRRGLLRDYLGRFYADAPDLRSGSTSCMTRRKAAGAGCMAVQS